MTKYRAQKCPYCGKEIPSRSSEKEGGILSPIITLHAATTLAVIFAIAIVLWAPSLFTGDPPGDAYRTVAIDGGTITYSQHWTGDYQLLFEGERDYNATVYLCHFKVDPEKEVALITSGESRLAYNNTPVVKSGPIVSYLFDLKGGFLRPLVILDDGTWVMFENIW